MGGNSFYKRLGKRIINRRKVKRLSQEELALLSHMDRTYLARIEEGKANPTVKVLNKVAKILKITLCNLLFGV